MILFSLFQVLYNFCLDIPVHFYHSCVRRPWLTASSSSIQKLLCFEWNLLHGFLPVIYYFHWIFDDLAFWDLLSFSLLNFLNFKLSEEVCVQCRCLISILAICFCQECILIFYMLSILLWFVDLLLFASCFFEFK